MPSGPSAYFLLKMSAICTILGVLCTLLWLDTAVLVAPSMESHMHGLRASETGNRAP